MAKATDTMIIDVIFDKENETKNKQRFEETNAPKDGPVIDKLYVSKAAFKKLGSPDRIHVQITAA